MTNFLNSDKELIVLEVANNHQGDFDHGKKIIEEYGNIIEKFKNLFDFSIKFQYRDLDTFIHPEHRDSDLRYVKRFLSTELSKKEILELKNLAESRGFISMCTPFDEKSVDEVVSHNYGILKIASASLDDWPLIEKVSTHKNIDVIASVGGSSMEKIKRKYSFMKNQKIKFALNYCVSLYPSELDQLNLSFIRELISSFKNTRIGFSTHEQPNTFLTAGYALHAGATIFEKHIALENKEKCNFQNDYSVYPEQLTTWLEALKEAKTIYGSKDNREKLLKSELDALRPLKRGVFAREDLDLNEEINSKNSFYAIPSDPSQLLSNDLSMFNYIKVSNPIKSNEPVSYENVQIESQRNQVEKIRDHVKIEIEKNNITTPNDIYLEVSHHYGIENFHQSGTCMCTLVNKDYCKKIIYQFPGQTNPEHFHKIKEETFILLEGDLEVILDGELFEMVKGDILTIPVMKKHSFSSKNGAIFEEISTEHMPDDSFYTDSKINENLNRKSKILLN